jgi:hypothetical protein
MGHDYCALTPALMSTRDSARSLTAPVSVGHIEALEIQTPVYRGGLPPSSVAGRRAAFVGWLREVLVPGVLARGALRAYPGYAVRLRYGAGSATSVAFTGGAPRPDAQSATLALHNGWTARTFGAPADASVTADGKALGLLIGGTLLSALLGMLIFIVGAGRPWARCASTSTGLRM